VTCKDEQRVLENFSRQTGIPVYGIDYKDTQKDVAAWLERHGNPFRATGFDAEGRVAIDFGVYGVPETFLVDGEGVIRYKHVGALRREDMETVFAPLLEKLK
jgi:cytochrome c biogenesis protein CcmG/thiol:disulfide interchange protein DsbE